MSTELTLNSEAEIVVAQGAQWVVTKREGFMVMHRVAGEEYVTVPAEYCIYVCWNAATCDGMYSGWRYEGNVGTVEDAAWFIRNWTARHAMVAAAPVAVAKASSSEAKAASWLATHAVEFTAYGEIIVPSASRSGVRYTASAHTCQCEAAKHGRACWHQMAARLALQGSVSRRALAALTAK